MARKEPALADILEAARGDKGGPSYESIAKALDKDWLVSVSGQTVSNYHHGVVARPDLEIVQALMGFYDMTMVDMPSGIRHRLERQRDRLVAASASHPSRTGRKRYAPRDSNPEPADVGLESGVKVLLSTIQAA